jgi:hypothetical protein
MKVDQGDGMRVEVRSESKSERSTATLLETLHETTAKTGVRFHVTGAAETCLFIRATLVAQHEGIGAAL